MPDEEYGIIEENFDWWGDNIFTYESINKLITDLRNLLSLLSDKPESEKLEYFKSQVRESGFDYEFMNLFIQILNGER
ncbi:hypothetical protein HPC37_04945 [Pasteurellaceae bacterium 20609_3]|uniref:hypothetical protein n=1 Tax=Spirabiliibacterium mucosae TaxID=28156 RepID=UPI001AAC6797|nr:hypothetical protein [Spirabiliibacterium mucosae]MBE2898178.1 hypothetical protein [Spirabiliibacterium mucosae]